MSLRPCIVLVVALVGALPASALADPGDAPDADAERHFLEGVRLSRLHLYDQAIAEYERSLALGDDPSTVYDLAQAHQLAGHPAQALMYFRIFAQISPKSPLRSAVRGQVARLTQRLKDEELRAPPTAPGSAVAASSPVAAASTIVEPAPAATTESSGGSANPALVIVPGSTPISGADVPVRAPRYVLAATGDGVMAGSNDERSAGARPVSSLDARPSGGSAKAVVAGSMLVVLGAGLIGGGIGAGVWAHLDATQVTQGVRFNAALESEGHYYALVGVGLSIGGAAAVLIGAEILRRHYAAQPASTLRAASSVRPAGFGFVF